MTTFYPISEDEKRLIVKLAKRGKFQGTAVHSDFFVKYNYDPKNKATSCVVTDRDNDVVFMDVVVKSPRDKDNPELARQIAFVGAITKAPFWDLSNTGLPMDLLFPAIEHFIEIETLNKVDQIRRYANELKKKRRRQLERRIESIVEWAVSEIAFELANF